MTKLTANIMTYSTDPHLQALHEELEAAVLADIPNVNEVRHCKARIIEYLARCVLELIDADGKPETRQLSLRVISNDAPDPTLSRGPCSPMKTEEIRLFEKAARTIFGEIESCTMSWGDR